MICPDCDEPIVKVLRIQWRGSRKEYVVWMLTEHGWTTTHPEGVYDEGSHFHLQCAATVRHEAACRPGCGPHQAMFTKGRPWVTGPDHVDHEFKVWGNQLPAEIKDVVYPGGCVTAAAE
jgi:hypothetical protein